MTFEDYALFQKHMPLYESYKKHAFIRNYSKEVYTEMIYLYTKYVNPKHNFSHWCSSCRMELVNYLYGWFTNDQNTTWYREQLEAQALAELNAALLPQMETTEERETTPAPAPAKRGRKPKTT